MGSSRFRSASLVLLFSACATSGASEPEPAPLGPGTAPTPMAAPAAPAPVRVDPSPAPPAPRTCNMFAQPGVLRRTALARLIDAGLPRWLQGVEGDRALANHRFKGWVVRSLYPGDPCYKDVDLQPGDVVQKVNGRSIERPEQAFEVLESLRSAPALVVEYLRDGKPRQFTIPISDEK
jgi:hypothetical protein